jgi:putative membrane protein
MLYLHWGMIGSVCLVAGLHFFFAFKEFVGRNSAAFYESAGVGLNPNQDPAVIGRILVNSALFNAILGFGLLMSFNAGKQGELLQVFLLSAIIVAGIVGGLTLKPAVFLGQSVPAAIALILTLLDARATTTLM